ncbi:DUF4922 domain-containing protein [Cupriavidus sp. WKF15]|uniref:ATP adenylyltransferase family protein n=1 Tax=Cupriavidus sp. WKF15 TaxID=3032282 RepID=UPI0023E1B7E2|nr:DUF4922 domain-containing protein [Cupriavidus sp. WKF15]WER48049.1 DUF4922 domain-containing protein [Cupriavidus sp. WKF15]
MPHFHLPPGTLWPAVVRKTSHALACGALHPIETTTSFIEDCGVCFVVRQVSSLARKDKARRQDEAGTRRAQADPFQPCDPDLLVGDISDSHLAVLNKFSVIDHHLLIVTRYFAPQEALLNVADFAALLACMAEYPSLGFYNGGRIAGSSQPHKHLQTVPLAGAGSTVPIAPLLALATTGTGEPEPCSVPGLGFPHAFAALDQTGPVDVLARIACERYYRLLGAVGLGAVEVEGEPHQSAPYNLLVMPEGMLLVPRRAAEVEGVALNALGFAGTLFVRNAAQMHTIRQLGPMTILRRAAGVAPPGRA